MKIYITARWFTMIDTIDKTFILIISLGAVVACYLFAVLFLSL